MLICLLAYLGKFIGCGGTALLLGFDFRAAGAVGTLMSCKGYAMVDFTAFILLSSYSILQIAGAHCHKLSSASRHHDIEDIRDVRRACSGSYILYYATHSAHLP